MQKIDFPSELTIFKNRISDRYLAKFEEYFSATQISTQASSLNDWFTFLKSILAEEKDIPSEIWALSSKLAWIIADVSFFIDNSELIDVFRHDPLFLGYFSLGIVEFNDFERGFKLLKEAFLLAESLKDWDALIDLSAPYILVLNNSANKNMVKDVLNKVKQIYKEKLASDPEIEFLISIIKIFAQDKKDREVEVDISEFQKVIQESKHHFYSGLALSHLAKIKDKSYENQQKAVINEFKAINARMRLIIAFTNLAYYYVSKAKFNEASEYSAKALKLADEIPKAKTYGNGIYIYPLFQKAWLLVGRGHLEEALDILRSIKLKSNLYKSPHHQVKANFGLANVYFLQDQNENAIKHIKESMSIIHSIENSYVQNHLYLDYANLLIDLKETDEISEILEKVNVDELMGCSKAFYQYVLGKYELNRFNVGIAKKYLEEALNDVKECENLYSNILFTTSEAYIHEFRISENTSTLEKAQEMINSGLDRVSDIPSRTKGEFLSALLFYTQGKDDEAEELLEHLTDDSRQIPRFQKLAEKLIDTIRDNRVSSTTVSPITNVRDVLRYLRDAKTLIEFNPR
ncbi:MAG: tetratricopeptide repeat protein [Candidatus Hodarchaeota archaeon]